MSREATIFDVQPGKYYLADRDGKPHPVRISRYIEHPDGSIHLVTYDPQYVGPKGRPTIGNPKFKGIHELEVVEKDGVEATRRIPRPDKRKLSAMEEWAQAALARGADPTLVAEACGEM
jgi:hypothetical protein